MLYFLPLAPSRCSFGSKLFTLLKLVILFAMVMTSVNRMIPQVPISGIPKRWDSTTSGQNRDVLLNAHLYMVKIRQIRQDIQDENDEGEIVRECLTHLDVTDNILTEMLGIRVRHVYRWSIPSVFEGSLEVPQDGHMWSQHETPKC
jgi:hypothetical protein